MEKLSKSRAHNMHDAIGLGTRVPEKVEIEKWPRKRRSRAWFESTLPKGMTKTAYAKHLADKSGGKIGMSTILNTLKGHRLTSYAEGQGDFAISPAAEVPFTEIVDS